LAHAFDMDTTEFTCAEELYVSDRTTATGYPLEHRHNRGKSRLLPPPIFSPPELWNTANEHKSDAQIAGRIKTDFTFLLEQNQIQIVPTSVKNGVVRKEHYLIEYELVPYVEGNNLKYQAWYPSAKEGQAVKEAQICITSAFEPGS
jgi:hypothetical protein